MAEVDKALSEVIQRLTGRLNDLENAIIRSLIDLRRPYTDEEVADARSRLSKALRGLPWE